MLLYLLSNQTLFLGYILVLALVSQFAALNRVVALVSYAAALALVSLALVSLALVLLSHLLLFRALVSHSFCSHFVRTHSVSVEDCFTLLSVVVRM